MGYFPKKVKQRRAHWVDTLGRKLVLLGFTGSHSIVWPNHPHLNRKMFYIERGNEGSEYGNSESAALLRMARRMELY